MVVSFAPFTLVYDFHPDLLGALNNDRDKYIKCLTVYYYVAMQDIDVKDVAYYLKRFGITEAEYYAMLDKAETKEYLTF